MRDFGWTRVQFLLLQGILCALGSTEDNELQSALVCPKRYGRYPHPTSYHEYLVCSDWKVRTIKRCTSGFMYEAERRKCMPDQLKVCTRNTVLVDHHNATTKPQADLQLVQQNATSELFPPTTSVPTTSPNELSPSSSPSSPKSTKTTRNKGRFYQLREKWLAMQKIHNDSTLPDTSATSTKTPATTTSKTTSTSKQILLEHKPDQVSNLTNSTAWLPKMTASLLVDTKHADKSEAITAEVASTVTNIDFSTNPSVNSKPTSVSSTTSSVLTGTEPVDSENRVRTPAKCDDNCKLPKCYCKVREIPGSLAKNDTPQMVLLSFDDSYNSVTSNIFNRLLSSKWTNPNGCPISATYFLSNSWTDYRLVRRELYERGHEIASHSINHYSTSNFNKTGWSQEIVGQRQNIAKQISIDEKEINGMRAPFLAIGGNRQFEMLSDNQFLYDSSIPNSNVNPPLWPYTLDTNVGMSQQQNCIGPCPTDSFPGLWEIPMTNFGIGGKCSMYDACPFPQSAEEIAAVFYANFKRHYDTNRSPFILAAHIAWYVGNLERQKGMIKFIETVLKQKEVWFVTYTQAIRWIQNPTPISKLDQFAHWDCPRLKQNANGNKEATSQ